MKTIFRIFVGFCLLGMVVGAIAGNNIAKVTPAPKAVDPIDVEFTASRIGRAAVLQALRDPASAQFGDVFAYESKTGPMVVCGFVNARNGFGGFTGPKLFVVGAGYASVQMQDVAPGFAGIWNKLCAGRTYARAMTQVTGFS